MTMLRLNKQQRQELSETLRDLANLQFAALVLGQAVQEGPLTWALPIAGSILWILLVGFSLRQSGRSR